LARPGVLVVEKGKDTMGTKIIQAKNLREGIAKVMGKSAKMTIRGKEVKISVLVDTLDALVAADAAVAQAKAAFHQETAKRDALLAEAGPLVTDVRDHLRTTLPDDALKACGIPPKKKAEPLALADRLAATVKRRATFEANRKPTEKEARAEQTRATLAAAFAPNEVTTTEPTAAPPEQGVATNGARGDEASGMTH
jgi:hypothetical protein